MLKSSKSLLLGCLKKEMLLPLFLLFFGIFSSVLIFFLTENKVYVSDNHLTLLARQFLKGDLFFAPLDVPRGDVADYFGKQYLYFGPFPVIVLMSFVFIFGRDFPQIIIGVLSLIMVFISVDKITKKFGFSETDRLWLAIFFVFSTVFLSTSIINITAYQVQSLGAALILMSLAEYFGRKRWWLIGSLVALAGMTRFILYLSLAFYLVEALRAKLEKRKIILLVLPIILSLILLGIYNYKRFHSIFESGYKYNVTLKNFPLSINSKEGLLSITHIPANLYVLFFKTPDPVTQENGGFIVKSPFLKADPWGMAIWFTSPLLLYLVKFKKNNFTLSALLTIFILIIPSLLYFGIGYSQFGYRYALDFLPFLFIMLLSALGPSLSTGAKSLIFLGVLFNCLYLTSLWGIYPHFFLLTGNVEYMGK